MAFGQPGGTGNTPAPPTAPPAKQPKTLAELSAMGTTAGAPVQQTSKGPPGGSGLPGSGPPQAAPGTAPEPAPVNANPKAKPPVVAHAGVESVGTHQSASPNKRANPPYGMSQ